MTPLSILGMWSMKRYTECEEAFLILGVVGPAPKSSKTQTQ